MCRRIVMRRSSYIQNAIDIEKFNSGPLWIRCHRHRHICEGGPRNLIWVNNSIGYWKNSATNTAQPVAKLDCLDLLRTEIDFSWNFDVLGMNELSSIQRRVQHGPKVLFFHMFSPYLNYFPLPSLQMCCDGDAIQLSQLNRMLDHFDPYFRASL